VAREVTDSAFRSRLRAYEDIEALVRRAETEMKTIKTKIAPELKRRAGSANKSGHKEELERVLTEGKRTKDTYKELGETVRDARRMMLDTVGDMKGVATVEDFRRFVQTPEFVPDDDTITMLERATGAKLLLLSESAFAAGDLANVLVCRPSAFDKDDSETKSFEPDHYIIAVVSEHGTRYSVVSYKSKSLLTFREIPYQLKILVLNKCMEENADGFRDIQSFRDLKTRMGMDPDTGVRAALEPSAVVGIHGDEAMLMVHAKAEEEPYPGLGQGERVAPECAGAEWRVRLGGKPCRGWRRRLDDAWIGAPFEVSGKRYASVEHFVQSAKFADGFPDFAAKFAIESGDEIATGPASLARVAGSVSGTVETTSTKRTRRVRPENVKPEADFYPHAAARARETAVRAKFAQNQDLQNMLLLTGDSKIVRFVATRPPAPDDPLMHVRRELRMSASKSEHSLKK
jgi:predicted NAD-dependent protein-ADP-ribosyltransferase YbiA (DUF1768 family)